jgi:hypothetical protein
LKKYLTLILLALAGLGASGSAIAADPVQAPEKALYKMTMLSSKSNSVVNVEGEMYYDFTESCDLSWTTNQKFTLNYLYSDGPEEKLNSQYTSRETEDGKIYDFAVRRSKDGAVEEEISGSATRLPDGSGEVNYTQPAEKKIKLAPGFLFPTQHTIAIINHALKGEHIFNAQMFDGSDGLGALEVNVVVGDAIKPDVDPKLANNPLLKSPAHKVRLAFYPAENPDQPASPQAEPDYEMTMVLHENGVISSMQIDYDQFSLKGVLQAIESAPKPKC